MNKSNNNTTNNTVFVVKKLEKLIDAFPQYYELLANNGEKNDFHNFINEDMVPPFSLSTIRTYCSDLNRIPEKKRLFLSLIIVGKLVSFIQMKRDNAMNFYQEHLDNLQETLKAFENEKETTQA